MRAHPGKCRSLLSSKFLQVVSISGTTVTSSTAEIFLGIIIDSVLNFENYLNSICNKASRKINALGRVISNCIPLSKRRTLIKIFDQCQFNYCPLICQFNYCPLIWMLQTHIHFEIDKIFIPEILGQLDMELKPYHI